jgi:hypothetical protein
MISSGKTRLGRLTLKKFKVICTSTAYSNKIIKESGAGALFSGEYFINLTLRLSCFS